MTARAYEVRVNGLVPTGDLVDALRDIDVAEHEFRTVLSGRFVDQAALYGFLNLLRSYGLEVVEVRRVPSAEMDEGPHADRETDSDTDSDTDAEESE